jgi:hypothetical protein
MVSRAGHWAGLAEWSQLAVSSFSLELDGGHVSQDGVQHLCSMEKPRFKQDSQNNGLQLTAGVRSSNLDTFCLFCCTAFLISSSCFADSSASRFVVSPAFDEFCSSLRAHQPMAVCRAWTTRCKSRA